MALFHAIIPAMQGGKQKILYVITKGNLGGAQRYVYDLATSLPKEQFDVVVACGEPGTLVSKLQTAGIRTSILPTLVRDVHIMKDIRVFFDLVTLFRHERPDVVHLNSSKIGGLGGIAGRIVGIPRIIFTGHGWAYNENRFFISKIIIALLHWITILSSHITIAVSKQTAVQISHFPFISNKVHVIHNGITPPLLLNGFEARQHLARHAPFNTWIGTISELHHNKGLDFLINAFADIADTYPDTGIVIVGNGQEKEMLSTLIATHHLQDRIIFTGPITDAQQYLKAFDVFTLTSRTEAFPYVILEAGHAELPVLASAVGGIPEIIHHEKTGLLTKPGDTRSIAHSLSLLLKDSNCRTIYGSALKKHILKSFSHDNMVNKTIEVYN